MANRLSIILEEPKNIQVQKSYKILCSTANSCGTFVDIYDERQESNPSDPELEDLLRAMLLFACAGLDSVVKQLVKDALESVIDKDEGARLQLSSFVERKLLKKEPIDVAFLAQAVTSTNPLGHFSKAMVRDITSGSLQSKDELFRVGACFNVPTASFISNDTELKKVFDVRNEISHEMDVDFTQPNGHHKRRNLKDMKEKAELVIEVAAKFISEVDKKLKN